LPVFLQLHPNAYNLDFSSDMEPCLTVLQKSGLILYPTDTIWGIGCDATEEEAVKKIFALKKRNESKTMIVLLADERDLLKFLSHPDLRIFDYLKKLKEPTTIIYEGVIGLAENLVRADGTVAIRVTRDPFCKHLIKRFRKPIVSTSANISGAIAPRFFPEITEEIKEAADYVVQYRQRDTTPKKPSTIVRWNKDATTTTIRP
jgi:L-threonylcarbamoyladenylate synthase